MGFGREEGGYKPPNEPNFNHKVYSSSQPHEGFEVCEEGDEFLPRGEGCFNK